MQYDTAIRKEFPLRKVYKKRINVEIEPYQGYF